MADRRVVITGVGITGPFGIETDAYFQALLDGATGIDHIKGFDPANFTSRIGGEAPELKMAQFVPKTHRKATKLMSRDICLAVVAADHAVRDAALLTRGTCELDQTPQVDPTRAGVNIGAGIICCDIVELATAVAHGATDGVFDYKKWGAEGMQSLTPLWLLKYLPNMPSCHISIIHDLQGPSNAVTCAEAAGQLAICEAARTIARNRADVMIAGGTESKVNSMDLLRQCLLNRASTNYNDKPHQAARPFDRDADGTVVGEGAGVVILEELQYARRRGARIYAEITGCGASSNFAPGFVETESAAPGVTIALQKAMKQAKLTPQQIQLLIPHGLGVRADDAAEAEAIRTVFGNHTPNLPICATKSRLGNCGAAAAAIDLVTTVLALNANKIPPNINCENVPAEYGLNLGNGKTIETEIKNAMTCCYTFGGQTAAIALSKLDED